jgi:hypothetical protein
MQSSLEGVLIAILVALTPADGRDREPGSGAANASVQERVHADVSACQRFADGMIRQNCVARVARQDGETIKADDLFPMHVSWFVPTDPGMPDHLLFVRNTP